MIISLFYFNKKQSELTQQVGVHISTDSFSLLFIFFITTENNQTNPNKNKNG